MKIVGAGLSKTGTTSLHRALQMLGFRSLHYDQQRLNDIVEGTTRDPDFRRYDDVDAVLDIPTAVFYEQLLDAYPDSMCILTVRDEQQWWNSIEHHFNQKSPVRQVDDNPFKWQLRHLVYGSATAEESLFRARYRAHNQRVRHTIATERLLVMDIAAGDGWEVLCPFLNVSIPDLPFPHSNRREHTIEESQRQLIDELCRVIPSGDCFIWVDECQLPLPQVQHRTAVPFLDSNGEYAGLPTDSPQAIAGAERLRRQGADWIVIAWPAFWWLDFYREFKVHLDDQFPCILRNERVIVFDLRKPQSQLPEETCGECSASGTVRL